jgi:RNA polymerase sigma-70 factor (ECF subfamily)
LERAVFVLHEVFDLTMPEVSVAVGRSDAACRQLLHRARESLSARRTRRRRLVPADAERVADRLAFDAVERFDRLHSCSHTHRGTCHKES